MPAAPPPQRSNHNVEPVLETYERAVKLQRTSIWPWILAGVFAVVVLIVLVIMLVTQSPNPDPASISLKLEPQGGTLEALGPAQSALGYSLRLPADFISADDPSTDDMPEGTEAAAWIAKSDSPAVGSLCRIWVIPEAMDIQDQLTNLNALTGRLDFDVAIREKSSHHRLGKSMLCVRALLEGVEKNPQRLGVIYLIADGRRTLMVIGVGAGSKAAEVQRLLDSAIRTIKPEDN
jgi:hypothetical protein